MLHITTKHTGKMSGMQSLSTSVLLNPICKERSKDPDSICAHCYAARMAKAYKGLNKVLADNTDVLTSRIIPDNELPIINAAYFRFEAFGDISSENQIRNYFHIAAKNPDTKFALWTKNPHIIKKAIEGGGCEKPSNLIIIFSSAIVNKPTLDAMDRYGFIDKVFTVYDKAHAADVTINCGSRKCIECRRCYSRNTERYINEILK